MSTRSRCANPRASLIALIAASVPEDARRTFSTEGTASAISSARSTSASVGALLEPGAGPLLFGVPAEVLANQHTPLAALWGRAADELLERLGEQLTRQAHVHEFVFPASEGRKIAWLHAHGEVLEEDEAGAGPDWPLRKLTVRLNPKELGQFETL